MNTEDIKDSFTKLVDTKLKSPYFASVFIIWVITNRVVLFGVFNFDETVTFERRIEWAYQQFQNFKMLSWLYGFTGFYATVVWSLLVGFGAMLFYNKLNAYSKGFYNWFNKSTIAFLQKIEASNWIERSVHEKVLKNLATIEEDLSNRRSEYTGVKDENVILTKRIGELSIEKEDIENKVTSLESIITSYQSAQKALESDTQKFKIIYAKYGKYDRYIEVTKILNEIFESKDTLSVENKVFGIDPYPFKVKDLQIDYQSNGEFFNVSVNEDEKITLTENKLLSVSTTDTSITKQKWLGNQVQFAELMSGKWLLRYVKNNKTDQEEIILNKMGQYFINDKHVFNIQVTELEDYTKIQLHKIKLNGDIHSTETLERINTNLIRGVDSKNFTLEYRKVDS